MSARLPVEELMASVVDTGLCTRCGTCVGACPAHNIEITDPLGSCLPVAGDRCDSCGLCLAGCPGASVEFRPAEETLFGGDTSHTLLGVVRSSYLAHAADPAVRAAGASGGVVTAVLLDLLRRGEIRGSLLYGVHEEEPWRGCGSLVESEEGIRSATQSRYHLSPMNTALAELSLREGSFAYAGLCCHVHGLRKLEAAGWRPRADIGPVIGIYCGNNLYFQATRVMLRKLGIERLEDVESLSYREGRWPGFFSVRTKDGKIRRISKLEFNQAIPFYVNRRCLFCIDLTNELAEISVGDGWAKEGADEDGWSLVLARSERGREIIERAAESGSIRLEEIGIGEAAAMHSHAFDLKKTGSFLRLGLWKSWGFSVPSYDRGSSAVKWSRRLAERIVSLQFLLCSSPPGRLLFRSLPAGVLGPFFRWLRRIWMERSRGGVTPP